MASVDPSTDGSPDPIMDESAQTKSLDQSNTPPEAEGAAVGGKPSDGLHDMNNANANPKDGANEAEVEAAAPAQNQKEKREEEDAALARMMAFQEEQDGPSGTNATAGGDDGADNDFLENNDLNLDPNVAFLGDDPAEEDDDAIGGGEAVHPNLNNPAAVALRARQAQQNAMRLNPQLNGAAARFANQPYFVRKLLTILQPSLRYTPLSLAAAGLLLHHTLRTRQQFYLALVYLQSSKLAYILLGNALIALAVSTFSLLTKLFLDGGLRPNEREAIGEHIRWDVTETCLALTIFRSELDVVTAIMFLGLVMLKCLHWSIELRGGHLRMTEEVFVYPDEDEDLGAPENNPVPMPKEAWYFRIPQFRWTHFRYYTLVQILLLLDIFAVAHCALSVATHGPSVDILFGFESAILLISGLSSMGMYHLHVIDGIMGVLHHLAEGEHHHVPVGGMAEVNENESLVEGIANNGSDGAQPTGGESGNEDNSTDRPTVIRPKTFIQTLVERLANPWRDRRATLSFAIELQAQAAKFLFYVVFFAIVFTYYGMPINIFREVYVSFQQLRRRLIAFNTYRRLTHNMDQRFESIKDEEELDRLGRTCIICRDQMDLLGGCKKLPGCGHAFHTHCLREWLVQQQTCPTCRADIAANEKKVAAARRAEERHDREEAADAAFEGDANENAAAVEDTAVQPSTESNEGTQPQQTAQPAASQKPISDVASKAVKAGQTQSASASKSDSEQSSLPAGWTTHIDNGSGNTYYYNQQNGQSSWNRPVSARAEGDKQQMNEAKADATSYDGQEDGKDVLSLSKIRPESGFPCLYRITAPLGAPVYASSQSPHLNKNSSSSPECCIPCGKLIVCTTIEYWSPPFEQAVLSMPDGYVRSADVERFLLLDAPKGS